MTTQNQSPSNDTIMLNGGLDYPITRKDGSTEKVLIRQLEIWEFPALLEALGKEIEMIMLFCAKPKEWAKTLPRQAWTDIVTKGEEINNDFFQAWVQRQLKRQERLMPGVTERVLKAASTSALSSQN
jgi:hypothetical protein